MGSEESGREREMPGEGTEGGGRVGEGQLLLCRCISGRGP